MKYTIFIAFIIGLFLLFFTNAQSQNTLEFSQVLLVSNADTVPQGKVWKITSFLPSNPLAVTSVGNSGSIERNFTFILNGQIVYLFTSSAKSAYYDTNYAPTNHGAVHGPIWIPAGQTVQAGQNVLYLSVIEFNVVP